MEKTCKLCGVTKPLTRLNFEDNDGYRDGFQNQCRQCRNAVRRARYSAARKGLALPPYIRSADILGERFGRLLVVGRIGTTCNGHALWSCRCDCGRAHAQTCGKLRAGKHGACECVGNVRRQAPRTSPDLQLQI